MILVYIIIGVMIGMCFAFSETYSDRAQAFYIGVINWVKSIINRVRS